MVGQTPGLEPIAPSEAKSGYNFLLKGIIVGPSNAGKTSLLHRFTSDDFNPEYVQTIGVDFAVKSFCSGEGDIIKIQMWDTAGNERFRTITNSYYRGCHGIMMVFDVGDKESFGNMEDWLNEVQMYTLEDTPVILVGNKTEDEDKREVSKEAAETFATENGLEYIECSAKDDHNVSQAFQVFMQAMLNQQKKRRANAEKKPMTKGLHKKGQSGIDEMSDRGAAMSTMPGQLKLNHTGQSKSKTCTII